MTRVWTFYKAIVWLYLLGNRKHLQNTADRITKDQKYKLYQDEVGEDILPPLFDTYASCSEAKFLKKWTLR